MNLSPEEQAVARSLLSKLLGSSERSEQGGGDASLPNDPIELARSVYLSRQRRIEHFGPVLFSEPAWDMLLVLFINVEGDQLSVTRLAELSRSPLTTAIRWLDYLENQRMIVRTQCPNDRRKFMVELSAKGRAALNDYFTGLTESIGQV